MRVRNYYIKPMSEAEYRERQHVLEQYSQPAPCVTQAMATWARIDASSEHIAREVVSSLCGNRCVYSVKDFDSPKPAERLETK